MRVLGDKSLIKQISSFFLIHERTLLNSGGLQQEIIDEEGPVAIALSSGQRPHHVKDTTSRLIGEVKHHWVGQYLDE